MNTQKTNEFLLRALNTSRFALYTFEGFPIHIMRNVFGIHKKPKNTSLSEFIRILILELKQMLEEDIKNINENIYFKDLIYPENPITHAKRYFNILIDSLNSSMRAKNNEYQKFSKNVKDDINSYPKYYRRNFHFQTDGYLSKKSAELYAHQTEILFKGTLGLSRRLLLAPLLKHIQNQKKQLKILEIGCGSGESTQILLNSCKNVSITAIDLSKAYIEYGKEKMMKYSNVEFIKMDGTDLSALQDKYDIVFSVYLFHELPEKERFKIIESCYNVLNPKGIMFHIDSIQMDDVPKYNWAIQNFPLNFHEPFYMNYIKNPLLNIIKNYDFKDLETQIRFLSKSILCHK